MHSNSRHFPLSVVGTVKTAPNKAGDHPSSYQSNILPSRAAKDSAKRLIRSQSSPKKVAAGKTQELLFIPLKTSKDFAAEMKRLTTP